MELTKRIEWAKVKLLTQVSTKFFGALLMNFQLKEDKTCPTAYTNNVIIGYNPDWLEKLSKEEIQGVIVHELLHIYFRHFIRFDITVIPNRQKVNMALDYAINHIIKYELKLHLPNNVLISDKYRGWNAENILSDLRKSTNMPQEAGVFAEGGAIDQGHTKSSQETKNQRNKAGQSKGQQDAEIQDKIISTFNTLSDKEKGNIPGSIKRDIEDYFDKLKGRVNWKKYIKNEIRAIGKDTYSSIRFNRKYLQKGIYLPYRDGKRGKIGLALDTSGSISNKEMEEFLGELKEILKMFPNLEILLYGCDAVIHGKTTLRGFKQFKVKEIEKVLNGGGGGTSHRPIFNDLEKNKEDVKVMFFFTDGYSDINSIKNQGKFKTYWVLPESSKDMEFNFGTVIVMYDEFRKKD